MRSVFVASFLDISSALLNSLAQCRPLRARVVDWLLIPSVDELCSSLNCALGCINTHFIILWQSNNICPRRTASWAFGAREQRQQELLVGVLPRCGPKVDTTAVSTAVRAMVWGEALFLIRLLFACCFSGRENEKSVTQSHTICVARQDKTRHNTMQMEKQNKTGFSFSGMGQAFGHCHRWLVTSSSLLRPWHSSDWSCEDHRQKSCSVRKIRLAGQIFGGILTHFKYCCNDTRVWRKRHLDSGGLSNCSSAPICSSHMLFTLPWQSQSARQKGVLDRKSLQHEPYRVELWLLCWRGPKWRDGSKRCLHKKHTCDDHAGDPAVSVLVEREKLLQAACLPCSLSTSVVQQSRHPSILMPTSHCENPSCFRRKSIPCVDRLPFGCIMFFAMKGSYEPENVFVGCFFDGKLLLCSTFKEVQHCSDGAWSPSKHSRWNTLGIFSKPPNSNGMHNADILPFFIVWVGGNFPKMCKFGPVHFTFEGLSFWYALVLD